MGGAFTCALTTDGSRWCWGDNGYGQYGSGDMPDSLSPVFVDSGWATLSAGGTHACGISDDGTLWCWGRNDLGQLGTGDWITSSVPVQVGDDIDWADVSAGFKHTCGLTNSGDLYCWGSNFDGQAGIPIDETTAVLPEPALVAPGMSWAAVSAGGFSTVGAGSTCGMTADGSVWCWGTGSDGQLGNGDAGWKVTSPRQVGADSDWVELGAAPFARKADGSLWNWGRVGAIYEFSAGEIVDAEDPLRRATPAQLVSSAKPGLGSVHSCYVRGDGTLWCAPARACATPHEEGVHSCLWAFAQVGADADWLLVSDDANDTQRCAIKTSGALFCWGENDDGEVGDGTMIPRPLPVPVASEQTWSRVATSYWHTCGVQSDGTLWCWGEDVQGELGVGVEQSSVPLQVGSDADWADVQVYFGTSCATKRDGSLWCWGESIGDGSIAWVRSPRRIDAGPFVELSLGGHSCGIKADRTLWCWGTNYQGELGNGVDCHACTEPVLIQIGTDADWNDVAAGRNKTTCALKTNGTLWCWGSRFGGETGEPTYWVDAPAQVPIP